MKKLLKKLFGNSTISLTNTNEVLVECGGNYCQDCC